MFRKALDCGVDIVPRALMNLALLYHTRAKSLATATNHDLQAAKANAQLASEYADRAKPLLDQFDIIDDEIRQYISQYRPLRLQCHRLLGQIYAGLGDLQACEMEFRAAIAAFPDDLNARICLQRALDVQGKTDESTEVQSEIEELMRVNRPSP